MNSSGVIGDGDQEHADRAPRVRVDRVVQAVADGRFPTWSWFCRHTTNRCIGTRRVGAATPLHVQRMLAGVEPAVVDDRRQLLACARRSRRSSRALSPATMARTTWWKSSAQTPSRPQPPSAASSIIAARFRWSSACTTIGRPAAARTVSAISCDDVRSRCRRSARAWRPGEGHPRGTREPSGRRCRG